MDLKIGKPVVDSSREEGENNAESIGAIASILI